MTTLLDCGEGELDLQQDEGGAVHFFGRSFLPWGALPYPFYHAKLGIYLFDAGRQEEARKMALWQGATIDHEYRPLYSLFSQEGGVSLEARDKASSDFFERVGYPAVALQFVHDRLGFVIERTEEHTIWCAGSGCKSGMGGFLFQDAGVISFGPHIPPIWEGDGFGIAGRAKNILYVKQEKGFTLSYHTRLAAKSDRKTGIAHLQDSGFSALWMEGKQLLEENRLSSQCRFEGVPRKEELRFSLLGRGKFCVVSKSQKVATRSLNRYEGPAADFALEGERGSVYVFPGKGFSKMEVIPLAGDDGFWGADFLITCMLDSSELTIDFSRPR